MPQVARPQHVRHRRGAHRQPRMPAVGFLHGVHGEEADGIDGKLIEIIRIQACGSSGEIPDQDYFLQTQNSRSTLEEAIEGSGSINVGISKRIFVSA